MIDYNLDADVLCCWLEGLDVKGDEAQMRDATVSMLDDYERLRRTYEPSPRDWSDFVGGTKSAPPEFVETPDPQPPSTSRLALAVEVLTYTGFAALSLATARATDLIYSWTHPKERTR